MSHERKLISTFTLLFLQIAYYESTINLIKNFFHKISTDMILTTCDFQNALNFFKIYI